MPSVDESENKHEEDPLVKKQVEEYIQNLNDEQRESLIEELRTTKKDFVTQMITGKISMKYTRHILGKNNL